LLRLAERGASILIAEQKTDLLAEVCDTAVVLRQGRVAASGRVAEVLGEGLEALGVAPPARVRLERAARDAGLAADDVGRLVAALTP
jgi:ABC-type glutathione transport system ATPase component